MKVSQLMTPVVASLIVVTLAGPMRAQTGSQAAGCAEVDWTALQPSAPAYVDALELARTLADSGLMVLCIGGSKMTGMFEGQKGEAIYRTDQGRFDVAFLPKPQNFDGLQIVERQESGRYVYSFAGRPTARTTIDSPRPVFLVKHTNRLILVNDKALADRLGTILARP